MTYKPDPLPTEAMPASTPEPPRSEGASGVLVSAGVILLVIAALLGLFGVLALLGGAILGQLSDLSGPETGLTQDQIDAISTMGQIFIFVFAGVALAIGLAHLMSGIGVIRRRGWARILGLVMAVLGILVWALILVSTLAASGQPVSTEYLADRGLTLEEYNAALRIGWIVGVSASGIALAAYTFVLVVLIRQGHEFA